MKPDRAGEYLVYPPREYREKLSRLHGRKVKGNGHRGKRVKTPRR
ncbi:hypothetical protein [Desulfurococcus amylolyticus]|nr:hypothetical protein [Desulfurococcus amylolyticus]